MIKKTQRRFITLIMSILLVVFGFIFLGTFVISSISNDKIITTRLDDIKVVYERENSTSVPSGSIYAKIDFTKNINGKHPILRMEYDSQSFSQERALNLVGKITAESAPFDDIGEYYYKIYPLGTVVICDTADIENSQRGTLIATAAVLIFIYGALFLAVWLISFKIIQPLQDNLNRQLQFISNASHELKTPITVISANADVIKTLEDSQWIDNIKSQTERMETLVTDMLMLAKVDEGTIPLSPETFNLSDEIVSTVLPFDALAFERGKHLDLDVPKDISYHGDRNSVKTILNILVDNAIKYSNNDGTIKVTLKKTAKTNKTTIVVFNTGSKIKSEDAEKLFNRFYRGDNSRSRETGGSGLGLAIAKGIADNNKWKITAHSEYGTSMTITITL